MSDRRNNVWEDSSSVYTEGQVEAVLDYCGIEVVSDTMTHFLVYCPFHGNTDSPAMAVDKEVGKFHCFNQSCGESGDLEDLLMKLKSLTPFQAVRVILKYRDVDSKPLAERLQETLSVEKFPSMSQDKVAALHTALWQSPGYEYMKGRGFNDETLKHFEVGYSPERWNRPEMVVVPMHDINGNPIGVIGRSIADKVFKNSSGLPKRSTAWNIHRAKKYGDTVIVCESSFDAMRVHQAGYPNVIALLGGHVSQAHLDQIGRLFSKVIIMTDFDKKIYYPNCRKCKGQKIMHNDPVKCNGHRPGRDLGRQIVRGLPTKRVLWAAYDDTCVYPHGAKDAGDMTDEEIRQCLKNAVSNLTYSMWDIEESIAA